MPVLALETWTPFEQGASTTRQGKEKEEEEEEEEEN